MTIALGSDHGGFATKEAIKRHLVSKGVAFTDCGCSTAESADYPVFGEAVAAAVETGAAERGILVCTTGIGMSITANRFPHVRAALCHTPDLARISRNHNDANVLVLGAVQQPPEAVPAIVDAWLSAGFPGEARHARRVGGLTNAGNRLVEVAHLQDEDPEVYRAILEHKRQEEETINLIASENLTSRAVREAQGSIMTNKYAEGYPGKRYYGGCEHVDVAEQLAIDRIKQIFGSDAANVQPHCGASANIATFMAFLKPGDTIMGMSLAEGGHLTHGMPLNMSGKWFNVVSYGLNDKEAIDYDAMEKKAHESKPKLIIAGASAYSLEIDFARFAKVAKDVGAIFMVDMAHYAGLIAGGQYPNPVPHADVVTSTTHKSLRGPRSGFILMKAEHEKVINSAVFPGLQGGPLMHIIAAKAVAFKEALSPEFKQYAAQVKKNAQAVAETLTQRGLRIVSGGTQSHVMLVDLRSKGITGKEAEAVLGSAHMTINKNTIPNDPEKPMVTSGVRIGTPAMTTRGFKEEEARATANLVADVLDNPRDEANLNVVRAKVADLAKRFPVYG